MCDGLGEGAGRSSIDVRLARRQVAGEVRKRLLAADERG